MKRDARGLVFDIACTATGGVVAFASNLDGPPLFAFGIFVGWFTRHARGLMFGEGQR